MLAVMACPEQRLPRNAARPVRVAVLGAGGGMAGSGRGPTPGLGRLVRASSPTFEASST